MDSTFSMELDGDTMQVAFTARTGSGAQAGAGTDGGAAPAAAGARAVGG
ncbi:hypothetical protein ACH4CE_08655 [Streptomyces gelaticus]